MNLFIFKNYIKSNYPSQAEIPSTVGSKDKGTLSSKCLPGCHEPAHVTDNNSWDVHRPQKYNVSKTQYLVSKMWPE